jgi:hypothetical protein
MFYWSTRHYSVPTSECRTSLCGVGDVIVDLVPATAMVPEQGRLWARNSSILHFVAGGHLSSFPATNGQGKHHTVLHESVFFVPAVSYDNILRAVPGKSKAFPVGPRKHLNAKRRTHQCNFSFPNHPWLFQFHAAPPQWKLILLLINLIFLRLISMDLTTPL